MSMGQMRLDKERQGRGERRDRERTEIPDWILEHPRTAKVLQIRTLVFIFFVDPFLLGNVSRSGEHFGVASGG